MAVPSNRNIIVKVFKKLSKCKDLEIQIAKMWKTEHTRHQLSLVLLFKSLGRD